MTKIKICGLKRLDDVEYVNELLPDYVGFVFAKSKRQVDMYKASKLISNLSKNIKTVGVFVDEDISKVRNIAESLKLDVLQFHGSEDEDYFLNFKEFELWKSVSIKVNLSDYKLDTKCKEPDSILYDENDSEKHNDIYNIYRYQKKLDDFNKYNIEGIVLDSSVEGAQGGTGVSFDWGVIPRLSINKKLILAGGLNINNVCEAIDKVNPFAVDVSSGVETDGAKDFNKIKTFIEKVRNIK